MRNTRINVGRREAGAGKSGRPPGAGETAGPQAEAAGPARDFTLALERHGKGTAVLILAGELDLYRAPEIEDALAQAIGPLAAIDRFEPTLGEHSGDSRHPPGEEVRRLAVDLRSVTFIDSTTLALLLAASRRQHARGDELLVLVGPQTPMTAFEVTGFDRLLAIRRVDDDPPRMRHVSTTHLPEEQPDAAETRPLAMPASLDVHEAPRRENHQDSGPAPLQGMLPVRELGVAAHREVSSETARQIARRALFREVNERINEIAGDFGVAEGFSILCECASSACQECIELTPTEYEHLRQMPTHFAVVRGHDIPTVERVVQENDRFLTVEKFDDNGITTTTPDPQRRRT